MPPLPHDFLRLPLDRDCHRRRRLRFRLGRVHFGRSRKPLFLWWLVWMSVPEVVVRLGSRFVETVADKLLKCPPPSHVFLGLRVAISPHLLELTEVVGSDIIKK